METLLGVYEIADIANVSASAVANWRKRFSDFPTPLAELKSGPVFSENAIRQWLARRANESEEGIELFYESLASRRGDTPELRAKVDEVVDKLLAVSTSTN